MHQRQEDVVTIKRRPEYVITMQRRTENVSSITYGGR